MTPLLQVTDLNISYGNNHVVHDVNFSLAAGQSLALIGESGSGKSTIARALLRLLPERSSRVKGKVVLNGQNDLLALSDASFRPFRGHTLGFIPQDPGNSFNPVRTIGSQAHEAAALIPGLSTTEQRERILDVFNRVGLPDPLRAYNSYPHQLSGGMLQRALIGLTVLPRPKIIVADEPTSALDVTVQGRILDLLDDLRAREDIGLIMITHDLAIAAEHTESVVVLKDGRIQESGDTTEVFSNPRSAYTKNLRNSVPALNTERYASIRAQRRDLKRDPIIELKRVSKTFHIAGRSTTAVDEVSLQVPRGTTHAIVGESGSGKTTAIRTLLRLEPSDGGEILIEGRRIDTLPSRQLREIYRKIQLVYQNPFTSLDPSWSVERIIREPLDRFRIGSRASRKEAVSRALEAVHLPPELARRKPGALSGGQRQRVAIARALTMEPEILVLDEPTSALDVGVQAEIFDVLFDLQSRLGLTYLLVSHDLGLVRQVADTVTVMRRGQVVESGDIASVFDSPQHAYTQKLIAAIPGTTTANDQDTHYRLALAAN